MTESNAHDWEHLETYERGNKRRCTVCGCTRFYSWVPGWPGGADYYDRAGNAIKLGPYQEPPCTALPVDGLFGVT